MINTPRLSHAITILAFALLISSCDRAPKPIKGDKLNDYFPKDEGKLKVLVTSEKKGFAQAVLKDGDKEIATFSISDLINDEDSTVKFAAAASKISGHPVIARGSAGTALLVNDRFQVQTRSKESSFSIDDRKKWLGKFDLAGLAKLR